MAYSSFQTHDNTSIATTDHNEDIIYSSNHVKVPPTVDQQHLLDELNNPSATSFIRGPNLDPIGVPTVKKRLHISHVLAALVSLLCLALAITAVANVKVS